MQSPALGGRCVPGVVRHSDGVVAVLPALRARCGAGLAVVSQGLQTANLLLQPLQVLRLGFLQSGNSLASAEPVPWLRSLVEVRMLDLRLIGQDWH